MKKTVQLEEVGIRVLNALEQERLDSLVEFLSVPKVVYLFEALEDS